MATFLAWLSQILLVLLGIFLMIVILLQRGRGGGLAGAFGGMGGQSAFGTKAGDVFTRITIVLAVLWVVVAGGSGYFLRASAEQKGRQFGEGPAVEIQDEQVPTKPDAAEVPAHPQPPDASEGAASQTGNAEEPAGGASEPQASEEDADAASGAPNSN